MYFWPFSSGRATHVTPWMVLSASGAPPAPRVRHPPLPHQRFLYLHRDRVEILRCKMVDLKNDKETMRYDKIGQEYVYVYNYKTSYIPGHMCARVLRFAVKMVGINCKMCSK